MMRQFEMEAGFLTGEGLPSSFSRFKVGLVDEFKVGLVLISRVRLWGNERKLRWRQAIATGENTRKKTARIAL